MKANEIEDGKVLMIGDLVIGCIETDIVGEATYKILSKVTGINHYGDVECVALELFPDDLDWQDGDDFSWIEAIPLTPEILEKNGFECNSNTKTFYRILFNEPNLVVEVRLWDKDTNVRIGKQCDGTFRVGYDWYINGMEIHFVHELQHALKLAGIDKEIEL